MQAIPPNAPTQLASLPLPSPYAAAGSLRRPCPFCFIHEMEFDSIRRLRTSNSRNFSRPFPSPLSTGALNTPTRPSKSRECLAQFPLSASHDNSLRAVTSTHDYLATNRLIDFAGTPQSGYPATSISHSSTMTWHTSAGNKPSKMSSRSSASSSSLEFRYGKETPQTPSYLYGLNNP
jgi:hypothetical protein